MAILGGRGALLSEAMMTQLGMTIRSSRENSVLRNEIIFGRLKGG